MNSKKLDVDLMTLLNQVSLTTVETQKPVVQAAVLVQVSSEENRWMLVRTAKDPVAVPPLLGVMLTNLYKAGVNLCTNQLKVVTGKYAVSAEEIRAKLRQVVKAQAELDKQPDPGEPADEAAFWAVLLNTNKDGLEPGFWNRVAEAAEFRLEPFTMAPTGTDAAGLQAYLAERLTKAEQARVKMPVQHGYRKNR